MAKKNVNIASSTEVKKYNYSQVYQTIYQEAQISKQDLATKLQLSLPTVSQNLLELEKVGLIEKAGYYSSTGGRKPSIIQAVRTARVAAGLEIIREMAHLVVVDLYGSLLWENRLHLPFCKSEEYFDTLCQWVENQLHTLQVDQSHLLGIGISIQGLVAPDGISIVFSPLQEGVMLTDFSARLSYPCVMIHDVEAAAAAEIWYQPDLKDAVYISLNRNMGGALIVNGAVHTGSHYSSATVEHMCIHPKGRKCYCGKQGCLEVYCSALALQQDADENADQFFSIPAAAVLMAIVCNVLWGSAFPFIKLGYRLFAIDSADNASILCFAGVRFMIGAALVWLAGLALNHRPLPMPRGKTLASACGLGLWQTAAQYFFYYSAVALLTGAMGGILNSTQSFMGVILAHFLYGNKDRLTPRKALGCALGFGGVLVATLGNHGGGSVKGMAFMLIASVIFALAGPWNKAVTQHADSFSVSVLNLGVGGLALAVLGFAMGGGLHPQSAAGIPVLLFLAFISGAGYVIWALLMKNNPVSRIAVFGLIIPIMNVLLSALLNGEPLFEWNYLAALVLVCIGIFLVNRAPQTQETKA